MIDYQKLTKRYYTISEVSEMFDVSNSLLRFWEGEFTEISPSKRSGGIRRYTVKDIQKIEEIFHLVKDRGFTIDGARKELKNKGQDSPDEADLKPPLKKIKARLINIRKQLDDL